MNCERRGNSKIKRKAITPALPIDIFFSYQKRKKEEVKTYPKENEMKMCRK